MENSHFWADMVGWVIIGWSERITFGTFARGVFPEFGLLYLEMSDWSLGFLLSDGELKPVDVLVFIEVHLELYCILKVVEDDIWLGLLIWPCQTCRWCYTWPGAWQ